MKLDMPPNSPGLCVTMPNYMDFFITRLPDADGRPLICRWTPWRRFLTWGRLVLLHEKAPGQLEPVDVGLLEGLDDHQDRGAEDTAKVPGNGVWEMSSNPGDRIERRSRLTANYQTKLVPGERYRLLWPGGEIDMWDWGTIEEHEGVDLKARAAAGAGKGDGELPALVLLPAAGVAFEAVEADEPYPDRARHIAGEGPHISYDEANAAEHRWRHLAEAKRRRGGSPGPLVPDDGCTWQPVD